MKGVGISVRTMVTLIVTLISFLCFADGVNDLDDLFALAGLPKKESYLINMSVRQFVPPEHLSKIKKGAVSDYDAVLLSKGDSFVGCCRVDFPERSFVNYVFHDGVYLYIMKTSASHIIMADDFMSNSYLMFFDYIRRSFLEADSEAAVEIKALYDANLSIKPGNYYYLPISKGTMVLRLSMEVCAENQYILDFEFKDQATSFVCTTIQIKINVLDTPLPDEVLVPNGFGDKRLVKYGSSFSLFVRDFLPTLDELSVLMTSKEEQREYEAEARSRPRVGPISKYSKPMDVSKYQ